MFPGSALAAALDVLDNPSLAVAARQSPLPADIGRLLALLPGHADRLGPVAAQAGVDPDRLLDAARHYVREVLLHPDAEDARVLGLGPNSHPEDLKQHYRALQAWLHPDRGGGQEGNAALSARVNAAWSRLRADVQAIPAEAGLAGFRPRWRKVELEAPRRSAAPWLGIAAVAASLGLVAWIVWPEADLPQPVSATPKPAVGVYLPSLQSSQGTTPTGPAETGTPVETKAAVAEAEQSPAAVSMPRIADAVEVPVAAPLLPPPAPVAQAPEPVSASAPMLKIAPEPARIATLAVAAQQSPPLAVLQPVSLAAMAAPAPVPAQLLQESGPASADVADADQPGPVVASDRRPDPPGIDAVRAQRARTHAAHLLDFLLQPHQAPPPIWHSGMALDQAERVRQVLLAAGKPPRARVLREQATWEFTPEQAQLRIPVETDDPGHGRQTLQARLQWKQDAWWVSQVALEEPR